MTDKLPVPFVDRHADEGVKLAKTAVVLDASSSLLTGTSLPAMSRGKWDGPTPNIRVLLIDGVERAVKQIIMRMHPDDFRKILKKDSVQWARLGRIANTTNPEKGIETMLAGDPSPQTMDPDHRWFEPEFEVADEDGRWGPVLHGRAAVFGFAPALKKACSVPVNPVWLDDRVRWINPKTKLRVGVNGRLVEGQDLRLPDAPPAIEG